MITRANPPHGRSPSRHGRELARRRRAHCHGRGRAHHHRGPASLGRGIRRAPHDIRHPRRLRADLVAVGALIAAAGIWQLARGGQASRWLAGLAGFAAAGFAGYLLIQLIRTVRDLGGDSMVLARPGLAFPSCWAARWRRSPPCCSRRPRRPRSAAIPPPGPFPGRPTASQRACGGPPARARRALAA